MTTPLIVPDEILDSFQAGVLAEVSKAVTAAAQAGAAKRAAHDNYELIRRKNAEITRLQEEIEALDRAAKESEQVEVAQEKTATAAMTRVPHLLLVVDRIRTDKGLDPWSICVHCNEQITRRGTRWSHVDAGFTFECRPGDDDTPEAKPVPLPAVMPATTTAADGVPIPAGSGSSVDTQAMAAVETGGEPSGEGVES